MARQIRLNRLRIKDFGLLDFKSAWDLQLNLLKDRIEGKIPDTLLLGEHPNVFTLGKSGKIANLKIGEEELKEKGIKIYRIERGGDITYHGPGQIVGYPIFYLKDNLTGIRPFIERIGEVLILVLKDFGIEGHYDGKYPGVWVKGEKIASIGIAVRHWVTFHGFALNVSTDLSYFDLINPCGLRAVSMTSIEKVLKKPIPIPLVKEAIKRHFNESSLGNKLLY